ncbi:MAG: DUF1801 domain-containing protein [Leptospiraceae bacterium]|nr:DUF1801 domain-containing protein [Leptospiraceae bacterium]
MTAAEYIDSQPPEAARLLRELRDCILQAVPAAEELMNYGIPAYALVPGGKRDQQVMMAAYKKHIGFYPHPAVIEEFADQLEDYKQGKGSIQLPLDKPLPRKLILAMVTFRHQSLLAE